MTGHRQPTVGLLHPGDMGSVLGGELIGSGLEVLWSSESRSPASVQRAERAGLADVGTLDALTERADIVVSVCPPERALAVAAAVSESAFQGLYVDANAVSPMQMEEIGQSLEGVAAGVVDGSIIGPPPQREGTTRVYLSGEQAGSAAELLQPTLFEPVVLGDDLGQASALKMAYAAYTKGSWALEASCLALARHYGLQDELAREWELLRTGRMQEVAANVRASAPKAWRFMGEMKLISETFAQAGLPPGFHEAAWELYRRWQSRRGTRAEDVALDELLGEILEATRPARS